jgi:DUF1680 family protein
MATLKPITSKNVELTGGFWEERNRTNREITLPVEYEQCKATGRLDAFKLNWKPGKPNQPHYFWDSDVAKWIEAVGLSLGTNPDPVLQKKTDEVIDWIASAQQPDGYLNVYFTLIAPEQRWTNLRDQHELYCAGHMMEAAVAYYEGTGDRKLLDVMCRFADYIDKVFGPGRGQKRGYPGHEEIELALVKLYRATDEKRYLKLAAFFVNGRGQQPHYYDKEAKARGEKRTPRNRQYDSNQAHLPVREQTTVEGHAVRAAYLYAGMADVAKETGDKELMRACRTLWRNLTEKRMYIHGGIGSTHRGERFTFDYDLPNEGAYAETCASIALVFFAHRMLQAQADGQYADVMERALYNGVISGVSLDGKRFFYDNYLASMPGNHKWTGQKSPQRAEWFGCACCPPNIARLLAGIGGYMYSQTKSAIYVHLYGNNRSQITIGNKAVQLEQRTAYPWKDTVRLKVKPEAPKTFTIALRIPGWCRKATIKVNGKATRPTIRKGYALIKREWSKGDTITLTLPMPVERIEAHPSVRHDAGRVALQRGPVVYCLEEADNGEDLNDIVLDPKAKLTVANNKALGVPTIKTRGRKRRPDEWKGELYRATKSRTATCPVKAIPYFLWANRGEGEMLVWIRQT